MGTDVKDQRNRVAVYSMKESEKMQSDDSRDGTDFSTSRAESTSAMGTDVKDQRNRVAVHSMKESEKMQSDDSRDGTDFSTSRAFRTWKSTFYKMTDLEFNDREFP